MRTIEIAEIAPGSGGALRASKVLERRRLSGVECYSILLDDYRGATLDLARSCPPIGYAHTKLLRRSRVPLPRNWSDLLSPVRASMFGNASVGSIDVVLGHHETVGCAKTTLLVSSALNSANALILQHPPIYGNSLRKKRIADAYALYLDMLKSCGERFDYVKRYLARNFDALAGRLYSRTILGILREFGLLIAVSKSIVVDMGFELGNLVAMRAGIGFEESELEVLKSLRARTSDFKSISAPYMIFSARLDVLKGFIDALLVAKRVVKSLRGFKLLIMGRGVARSIDLLNKFIKFLDLKENVSYLGFLPRDEAFRLNRGAGVLIYPSHVDAYPYTVAESLIMGVPVVAYDIPALTLNYGSVEGLFLVNEGDIEAMAQKVLELAEKRKLEVGMPTVHSIREVSAEEVSLLRRYILKE